MRQTSAYFEANVNLTTSDEVEHHLIDTWGAASLTGDSHLLQQRHVGDADVQLHSGRFGGSYGMNLEVERFVIASTVSRCAWQEGLRSGDLAGQPALFRPRAPFSVSVGSAENRSVVFDGPALERTARLLYGVDDLTLAFDSPQPVTRRAGAAWLAVSKLAAAHGDRDLLPDDLIRASLFRLLSVTALESFRLVGDRRALRTSAVRQSLVHRLAREFLRVHAALPITIDDAAAAAGASTVEVIAAFQALESVPTSPTAYLRSVRLAAAHEDLRAGDPTAGDTVSVISRRWGYGSASRFAADYRFRYGVNPRWVLDR